MTRGPADLRERERGWPVPGLKLRLQMRPRLLADDLHLRVYAGQTVVRGGIEPPTFRFSGGRSYQLSYLTSTGLSEDQRRLAASPR
jgi:hypothetical protein